MNDTKEMTIGEICNYAAGEIMDGWEIEISISEGCAGVRLYTPYGNMVEFCCDDSLEDQVKEAVSYSREHDERT